MPPCQRFTRRAVSREVVAGESGILVPERADALADALVALVQATDAERAMRIAAAKNAARPYTLEALTDQLETQYAQVRAQLSAAL